MEGNDMFEKFKKHYSTTFKFLESDFECGRPEIETTKYSCYMWQKNKTTGIRCGYQPRDGLITLLFYKLINDEFPPYETKIDEDTTINSFYIGDIIVNKIGEVSNNFWDQFDVFKNPHEKILENLEAVTKKYADDILRGDFSAFPELEKIVKQRWRNSK